MVGHRQTPKIDDGITYVFILPCIHATNSGRKIAVGTCWHVFQALVDVCPYPPLISRNAYIGTRSLSSLSSWLHNMSWNVPIPPRNQNKKWFKTTVYDLVIAEAPPRNISPPENGVLNLQLPRFNHPGRKVKGIQKSSLRQLTACEKLPALHGDDLALRLLSHFTCDSVILLSTLPFEPFVSTNLGTNFGARRYLGQDSETNVLFTFQPW